MGLLPRPAGQQSVGGDGAEDELITQKRPGDPHQRRELHDLFEDLPLVEQIPHPSLEVDPILMASVEVGLLVGLGARMEHDQAAGLGDLFRRQRLTNHECAGSA